MRSADRWWTRAELVAWSVVAVVGIVTITQALRWPRTQPVAVVQSLTPYFGVVLAPVAALGLWRQWRALTTTTVAVGVGLLLMTAPVAFPGAQRPADSMASGMAIASVNLLDTNDRVDEVADVLLGVDADMIVLIEYTREHQSVLARHALAERYDHRIERSGPGPVGIAVWSRSPVAVADPLPTFLDSVDVVVDHVDGQVRVVGVHVPTPVRNFDAWRHDLALIERIGHDADRPTAVVGDFNATYWHPDFRDLLDAGFVDAHIENGRGFAASWPTDRVVPPFVQLDRALTAGGLVSTAVDDFEVPGSDHRGFVVTVAPAR